jgi:UDP-glucose 4-epimerase
VKILVTGANGFLGQQVVAQLAARDHQVRGLVRRPNNSGRPQHVEIVVGDLREVNLASALHHIDAVVHLAATTKGNEDTVFASTVLGTERLLKAMVGSATRRIIHISSFAVYDWKLARGTLDETALLNSSGYTMGGYHIAKIWQERLVRTYAKRYHWDLTILRPGYIWGKGNTNIAGMGRHLGNIYVLFGPISRLPLTHVENCADCIVTTVESPSCAGIFNVVDDYETRVWRYARDHARGTKRHFYFLPVPYSLGLGIAHLFQLTSRQLFGNRGRLPSLLEPDRYQAQFKPLRYSNEKLRLVLGWTPKLSYEECLRRTYLKASVE